MEPLRRAPVLACVDGSAYSAGVCDHAAWLAAQADAAVQVLHLDERDPLNARRGAPYDYGRKVAHEAADRVIEAGAELADVLHGEGSFGQIAPQLAQRAATVVLGQRGKGSPCYSVRLGENARRLTASAASAICLAAPSLKPISRALILFNAASPDEALSDFVAASPVLDGLDCALIGYGARPSSRSKGRTIELVAEHPDEAIRSFLRRDACDLLVLPRSALLLDSRRRDLEGLIHDLQTSVVLPGRGVLRTVRL